MGRKLFTVSALAAAAVIAGPVLITQPSAAAPATTGSSVSVASDAASLAPSTPVKHRNHNYWEWWPGYSCHYYHADKSHSDDYYECWYRYWWHDDKGGWHREYFDFEWDPSSGHEPESPPNHQPVEHR
jgi:hypothetical protein